MWYEILMPKKEMERKGTSGQFNMGEANEFNSFIGEMDLVDVPVVGSKFTWLKPKGGATSILDCFLVSETLMLEWKVEAQYMGNREISYRKPIWIEGNPSN